MQSLASRIQQARSFSGITRSELARRVGVKPSAAVQWEQDGGTSPSVRNMIKIAKHTAVSFEWLATGRGMVRPDSVLETPAVTTDDFAHSLFEEQMLLLARGIPSRWREPLLNFLLAIVAKKP